MAKDGTNRGGARIGAGAKKKPLAERIAEGNPGKQHRRFRRSADAQTIQDAICQAKERQKAGCCRCLQENMELAA